MKKPEILSPIQDFISLKAAIDAGADAVFFGVRGYNMRVTAKNFTVDDLPKIAKTAHKAGVKAYIALNTIIYDREVEGMRKVLEAAHEAGIDAVICWDNAVIQTALEVGIEVHLSTQASVSNSRSAIFYRNMGITRVVLARECSLEQAKAIKEEAGVEIETFIHGAMCVSISGRCFMSQSVTGRSANRGACMQPCRRKYKITDTEGDFEYEMGEDYVMSAKDMCSLPFIEQLVFSGIDCFKIEGRNKSPEYVHDVTAVYREAVDFVWDNKDRQDDEEFKKELAALKEKLMPKLERVFNRGFSTGFYLGKPVEEWSKERGSVATERKIHLGAVTKYYPKLSVAEIMLQAGETLSVGDEIIIQGEATGVLRHKIESMEIEHKKVTTAKQGEKVAIKVDSRVRANDIVSRMDSVAG